MSLRDVEDLLAAGGVVVSYEALRAWIERFGPQMAAQITLWQPQASQQALRHPAQRGQSIHMRADPIRKPLARGRLRVDEARCTEDRNEDLGPGHFSARPIDDVHRLTCCIAPSADCPGKDRIELPPA